MAQEDRIAVDGTIPQPEPTDVFSGLDSWLEQTEESVANMAGMVAQQVTSASQAQKDIAKVLGLIALGQQVLAIAEQVLPLITPKLSAPQQVVPTRASMLLGQSGGQLTAVRHLLQGVL